ncbi:acyl carrier protein [Alkalilimnicola ehrlichii]|nr:phosphopantetheine-binding protein [Alkalilimnicola ehrlichii]
MDLLSRQVEELISHVLGRTLTISPEKRLAEDLHFDSLKMFDLMMLLEEKFDILIPVGEIYHIETVHDLVQAVANLDPQLEPTDMQA